MKRTLITLVLLVACACDNGIKRDAPICTKLGPVQLRFIGRKDDMNTLRWHMAQECLEWTITERSVK